jgi:hypothetical protein
MNNHNKIVSWQIKGKDFGILGNFGVSNFGDKSFFESERSVFGFTLKKKSFDFFGGEIGSLGNNPSYFAFGNIDTTEKFLPYCA